MHACHDATLDALTPRLSPPALVRPAGPLFVGAEYRRISTKYPSGTFADNHVNLAMGFEF